MLKIRPSRWHSALVVIVFLACPTFSQISASRSEANRLLSQVRAATGGASWSRIRTLHERGTFHAGELTGSYEVWLDFGSGLWYTDEHISISPVGDVRQRSGWNGRVAWVADQSGDVCLTTSEKARSDALGFAYLSTYSYLSRLARPAQITAQPAQQADGEMFDVVRVRPRGSDPIDLWIDSLHHVRRLVHVSGIERTVTSLDDFRQVSGVMLPFQSTERDAGANGPTQSRQASAIDINEALSAEIFNPTQPSFTDIHFPSGRISVTSDFRFIDDQIYLPVSVNGQTQQNFVFDTGSTQTIDLMKARSLGLRIAIAGTVRGMGPASVENGLTRVERLELAGLTLQNQICDVNDLSTVPGNPIEGILGYELARRTVVSIDYSRRRITFMKPDAFRPSPYAVRIPFRFGDRSEVLVQGMVNGFRGDFQIDTGAGDELTINRPFAERYGLITKYHAKPVSGESGIGGSTPTVAFYPRLFSFGAVRQRVHEAQIVLGDVGSGAEEHMAGIIGNEILKRFTLTLDYTHRVLYFERTKPFARNMRTQPAQH